MIVAAPPRLWPFRSSLGVGVVRGPHRRDEQLHRVRFAGDGIEDVDGVAGEIDEHLLPTRVGLAHRRAQFFLPGREGRAKPRIAVRTRSPLLPEFLAVIRGLDVEVLALCVFQTALDSVVHNNKLRDAEFSIGTAISGECWSRGLTNYAPQLAKRIEKYARRKHKTSTKRRQQVARAQAARAGYRSKDWDRERYVQAGNWAIDQLLTVLPDVFITTTENEQGGPERLLVLLEGCTSIRA